MTNLLTTFLPIEIYNVCIYELWIQKDIYVLGMWNLLKYNKKIEWYGHRAWKLTGEYEDHAVFKVNELII